MKANEIVVEKGIPPPECHLGIYGQLPQLRQILKRIAVGDSFFWDENTSIYRAAKDAGVTIKTRKLEKGGYRIWKVSSTRDAPAQQSAMAGHQTSP